MRLSWLMPCLILLVGCETTPTTLPTAEPLPADECRWEIGDVDVRDWAQRALGALEAEDFVVRDTELELGVISAERTRDLPYYGDRYDRWEHPGLFGGFGLGSRGGFATGMMIGFGGGGGFTQDATELERVSLVANDGWVRASRDIQVIDWRGELRETRSGSDAGFCGRLRQAISARTAEEVR
ncbi:hypothetical protein F0A17_20095 [Billgrantia pellis]|uniref:DUF4136 domain-containing protein n=1 Tax=Billgrantia pellis TaxID=2606936 RepID=A0A7V7FWN0_9GAMM|nr:hypothetical protein [Halomonas pellis]KAA0009810.1 hypothetical protein F0A17_20095 [Halomonas pellis]